MSSEAMSTSTTAEPPVPSQARPIRKVSVRTGKRYRPGRVDNRYDVIVIGSGIGGLTTAALLSLLGQKVCVLEQHYTAGGYTHSYERNGYEWDVGVHYIGEVHRPYSTLRRVFDLISQNRLQWAPMEPVYDRIFLGDEAFDFVAGRENFIESLIEAFPDEVEAIHKYVSLIREISTATPRYFAGQGMPPILGKVYNRLRPHLVPDEFYKTTREVMESLTSNQKLISVLAGQWGDYGQVPSDSAFFMHALIAKHFLAGGAYPVGGSSAIARSIIPTIQEAGGEVFTYADVDRVIVTNNRATGVRMVDGTEIKAAKVVSNAGFMPTMAHLLPRETQQALGTGQWTQQVQCSSAHLCFVRWFQRHKRRAEPGYH